MPRNVTTLATPSEPGRTYLVIRSARADVWSSWRCRTAIGRARTIEPGRTTDGHGHPPASGPAGGRGPLERGRAPRRKRGPERGAPQRSSSWSPAAGTRSRRGRATERATPAPSFRTRAPRPETERLALSSSRTGGGSASGSPPRSERGTRTLASSRTAHHADAVVEVEVRGAKGHAGPRLGGHADAGPRWGPADALLRLGLACHHLGPYGSQPASLAGRSAWTSGSTTPSAPAGASAPFAFRENTPATSSGPRSKTVIASGSATRAAVDAHGLGNHGGSPVRLPREGVRDVHLRAGLADEPGGLRGELGDTPGMEDARFHDLVARLETFIGWTNTRVAALYRLNALSDEDERVRPPRWRVRRRPLVSTCR